nr:MAG TPA: hypothetical protein [Caudoviricetes sp.]
MQQLRESIRSFESWIYTKSAEYFGSVCSQWYCLPGLSPATDRGYGWVYCTADASLNFKMDVVIKPLSRLFNED